MALSSPITVNVGQITSAVFVGPTGQALDLYRHAAEIPAPVGTLAASGRVATSSQACLTKGFRSSSGSS